MFLKLLDLRKFSICLAGVFFKILIVSSSCLYAEYWNKKQILDFLVSQYPVPFNISPDGTKILYKTKGEKEFELLIKDTKTGEDLRQLKGGFFHLSVTWSPDSKKVAFLTAEKRKTIFTLHIWDIKTGTVSTPNVPNAQSALPPMRWSPDSTKLLYFANGMNKGDLIEARFTHDRLVDYRLVDKINAKSNFNWDPWGTKIYYTDSSLKSKIHVSDKQSEVNPGQSINLGEGTEIDYFEISPQAKKLAVAVREPRDNYFKIKIIPIENGSYQDIQAPEKDLLRPVWLNENKLAYEQSYMGESKLVFFENEKSRILEIEGSHKILSVSGTAQKLYINSSYPDRLPLIQTVDLHTGKLSETYDNRSKDYRKRDNDIITRKIEIKSKDGLGIPVILRSPNNNKVVKHALIWIHGGPKLQELPHWDSRIAALVKNNISVAVVNYRGSPGYGRNFELNISRDVQVADILATAEYLKDSLKLPNASISLLGLSNGSVLAEGAYHGKPGFFHSIILVSNSSLPQKYCINSKTPSSILAFHGEEDNLVSEIEARQGLLDCYGKDVFQAGNNKFTLFSGEGHNFHSSGAWAEVIRSILSAVS